MAEDMKLSIGEMEDEISDILLDEGAVDFTPPNGFDSATRGVVDAINEIHARTRGTGSMDIDEEDDADEDDDDDVPIDRSTPGIRRSDRIQTEQEINARANWLNNEIASLQQARAQGLINQQQYEYGITIARNEYNNIIADDCARLEHKRNIAVSTERWHEAMSEQIPEWKEPRNRMKIANTIADYCETKGITRDMLAKVSDPIALRFIMDAYKTEQKLRGQEKAKLLQRRKQKERMKHETPVGGFMPDTGKRANIAEQTNAVANLLMGLR